MSYPLPTTQPANIVRDPSSDQRPHWQPDSHTPEPTELPQSIQEAVKLVNKLRATPTHPGILDDLIKAVHRTTELQGKQIKYAHGIL